MSLISASIVLYNTRLSDLRAVVESYKPSKERILYLIDNSPVPTQLPADMQSADVHYVFLGNNLGYGSAHNVAIRRAIEIGCKYHAVLNPDTYWTDPVLDNLMEYMEAHNECGLLMPKVLYPNGEIQYLCKLLPTPANLISRRFVPIKKYQEKRDYRYELHYSNYDKEMEVPSLSGCFMFLRIDSLQKAGLFDERFFMYAEDLDLCRRIGEVSKTIYYPHVAIFHQYEKGSYKNKKLLKYHVCSMVKYFNKWGWFFDKHRRRINRECVKRIHSGQSTK